MSVTEIELGNLGEKSNTWRENGPCIYSTHRDPYILALNYGLPNNWVCSNGYIDCSRCSGATKLGR